MANEISLRLVASVSSTLLPGEPPFQPSLATYDCASGIVERGVQVVGTTEEALRLGDVGTVAVVGLQNLDPTNYVEVGRMISATFEPFGKISAGRLGWLEIASGVTWYLRANTASVNVGRFIPST